MSPLAPTLQKFFTDRLLTQRQVSPATVAAYLAALMKRCSGNLSRASREADLARHHLRDLLKKRGLYGMSWLEEGEGES